MLTSWASKYVKAAENSRLSSQFGALVILVIGLTEGVRIARAILASENPSWDAFMEGTIPTALFIVAFGSRFLLLFRYAANVAIRTITWWAAVGTVWFCIEFYGPQPGVFYDLFNSFPLEMSGLLFILAGSLRFFYFSSISFKNDLYPNSR